MRRHAPARPACSAVVEVAVLECVAARASWELVVRLADTVAAELAQSAWLGHDAPGVVKEVGVRAAILVGLPGDFTLEDIREWAQPALRALADAGTHEQLEGRLVGALAAALVLGAKLQESNGT